MTPLEITEKVTKILSNIIEANVESFRRDDSFKVRPDYGYSKYYLDWIDGSYDMSLQSLVHHIMHEEGIYKAILNEKQFKDLEEVIKCTPEGIYSPHDEDEDYERIQYEILDTVYFESVKFVGSKLIENGFDVNDTFSEYLNT
jgi:hypothetical protein